MHHHTTFDDALLSDTRPAMPAPAEAVAEDAWAEHGWGLDGRGLGLLLGLVAVAAVVARLFA